MRMQRVTRCVVFKRALLIKAVIERIVESVRWEDDDGGRGVAAIRNVFLLSLNRNISLTTTETELQNRMKRENSDLGSGGRRGEVVLYEPGPAVLLVTNHP